MATTNIGSCECCGQFDCCHCGECCYSSNSRATVTVSVGSLLNPESVTDPTFVNCIKDLLLQLNDTTIPYYSCDDGAYPLWIQNFNIDPESGELVGDYTLLGNCTDSGASEYEFAGNAFVGCSDDGHLMFGFGAIFRAAIPGSGWLETANVSMVPYDSESIESDCCVTTVSGVISVNSPVFGFDAHYEADWTITITNNRCCSRRDGGGLFIGCDKEDVDCQGDCSDNPLL